VLDYKLTLSYRVSGHSKGNQKNRAKVITSGIHPMKDSIRLPQMGSHAYDTDTPDAGAASYNCTDFPVALDVPVHQLVASPYLAMLWPKFLQIASRVEKSLFIFGSV
jgi:hypothetical protein